MSAHKNERRREAVAANNVLDILNKESFQSLRIFFNESAARAFFEQCRWPDGVFCPVCGQSERVRYWSKHKLRGFYQCHDCDEGFTVRTDTIFDRSHIPLSKWAYIICFYCCNDKRSASTQLGKEIGTTQATAWKALKKLANVLQRDSVDTLTEAAKVIFNSKLSGGSDAAKRREAKRKRLINASNYERTTTKPHTAN